MISGFIASMFRAVSIRVSPFVAELVEAAILKVSALIRLAAISKEVRVLVDARKQIDDRLSPQCRHFFDRSSRYLSERTGGGDDMLDILDGQLLHAEYVPVPETVFSSHVFICLSLYEK